MRFAVFAFFVLAGCAVGTPRRDAAVDATDDGGVVREDAGADSVDAGQLDASCVSTACGATERCYDGVDNDCDGQVEEGCPCAPGTTARCLPGSIDPTIPLCSWGEMTCEGPGEFGTWGVCGAGTGSSGGEYGCRRIGILGAAGFHPSANFQAWLEQQGAIVARFHASADAPPLRRDELETFDLVIVDWLQRNYSSEESATLAEWVSDGGALMVMTGHDDDDGTIYRHVSLLAALGPTFDAAGGLILSGPANLLPHPTTAAEDGLSTLPPITFLGGYRVSVPLALSEQFTTIALIDSSVVGVAGTIGSGRVVLFGDEWIEFDSEWSTMPPVIQFWNNLVRWLSPDETLGIPRCD